MNNSPMPHLSKGFLLVASPEIDSGLYAKSVVLLCEHNESGSFGLIINKPLHVELPEEVLNMKAAANQHLSTWTGGPIQVGQMMLLHSCNAIPDQVLQINSDLFFERDLDFLQTSADDPEGPFIRLCFGYSGWETGQLEKELAKGYWFILPATSEHLFKSNSETLWKTLLSEMGGMASSLSNMPDDLSLN